MTRLTDQTLRDTPELELARELVKPSYPATLPVSYSPPDLPPPKGEMVFVATRTQEQSREREREMSLLG